MYDKILSQIDKPELWVYSNKFEKLGIINFYSYLSIEENFRGLGAFQLNCDINKNNNKLILKDNIIWVNGTSCAMIIDTINNTSDAEKRKATYTIKGYLMNIIFTYRSVLKTMNFSNMNQSDIIATLIDSNMINPADEKRRIEKLHVDYDKNLGVNLTYQTTGNQVWDAILNTLNVTNDLGIRVNFNVDFMSNTRNYLNIFDTSFVQDVIEIDNNGIISIRDFFNPTMNNITLNFKIKPIDKSLLKEVDRNYYYIYIEIFSNNSTDGRITFGSKDDSQFYRNAIDLNTFVTGKTRRYFIYINNDFNKDNLMNCIIESLPNYYVDISFRISIRSEEMLSEDFVYTQYGDNSGPGEEQVLMNVETYKGVNRSYSQDENPWVILDTEHLDIKRSEYIVDIKDEKNVAYVFGEGEGAQRKNISTGELNKTGLDRKELFVDARDLQSEDIDGNVMPPNEYLTLLKDRGLTKLGENASYEQFNGEINTTSQPLRVFGRDYFLGDIITIDDKITGRTSDTRIVLVRYEWTNTNKSITLENDVNSV